MATTDDRLLTDMARRNWLILGGLVLISMLWRSPNLTMGVAGGGLLTIGGYHWLHGSLVDLLRPSGGKTRQGFLFSSLVRFLVLSAALFVLLVLGKAHPVGLAVGVSVVVLNLTWTSLTMLFQARGHS
jgi:hypothetical protein